MLDNGITMFGKTYKIVNDLLIDEDGNVSSYRYKDGKIISVRKRCGKWYVDENGIKHLINVNGKYQEIECCYEDKLIYDHIERKWKVATDEDLKYELISQIQDEIKKEKSKLSNIQDLIEYVGILFYVISYLHSKYDINPLTILEALFYKAKDYIPSDVIIDNYFKDKVTGYPQDVIDLLDKASFALNKLITIGKTSIKLENFILQLYTKENVELNKILNNIKKQLDLILNKDE
jgi:hypothetical protein